MEILTHAAVDKFIYKLEPREYAKTIHAIERLKEFGRLLPPPHSKKVNSELFELRIRADMQVRLLYGFRDSRIILLLGFIKKTNKLPLVYMKLAQQRLAGFAK